jgi:hypothetical protein
MAGVAGNQGVQISMTVTGEDDATNTDPNYNVMYWNSVTYAPNHYPIEERFERNLNIDSTITFKEVKMETNAEDFFVHIVYKLNKHT